ncbi:MAG: cytidylyltransferase domain-containing protein [Pseudomonadota bacterium]|uniref:acylneuraminate cytidylyltransferase n=1 Tax=Roseovarius TaxID=74030 RepID=UPI0022A69171|nr:acylneuraminate cytidylyltransferase [Roseovarius sp. EGI FJ00037]MCZ0811380.1 acylneuraminate cytidylyltransferase [Roseovarius sp. EGI FJ00037]
MNTGISTAAQLQTACIVLARGGSKGVVGKNLRRIDGVSLIARSVRAGVAAPSVGNVYVSTDDPLIALEAREHGAHVIERPAELAGDSASSETGWLHALTTLCRDMPGLKRLVFLQCTSPFTTGDDIEACLAAMQDQGADCALSVIEDHSFLWHRDAQGFGIGTNHAHNQPRQRRQDLAPSFRESGAIYCVDAAAFARTGHRFCGKVALCQLSHPPVEIDSEDDLALCNAIARQRGGAPIGVGRLRRVRAIVMDFDGVHTDNLVTMDENGVESVRVSRGDGLGLSMLREAGAWRMLILSKERNPVVTRRAAKLKLPVMQAVDDKPGALRTWLADHGLEQSALLYVGNDVNDKAAMLAAGLSACPSDSHPDILAIADWVLPQPGGAGALRAIADALLAAGLAR